MTNDLFLIAAIVLLIMAFAFFCYNESVIKRANRLKKEVLAMRPLLLKCGTHIHELPDEVKRVVIDIEKALRQLSKES